MGKIIMDLKAKVVEKDNKINDLQTSMDSFQVNLSNLDEEIMEKDKDIVQITRALQSIKQQKYDVEKWVNKLLKEREDAR